MRLPRALEGVTADDYWERVFNLIALLVVGTLFVLVGWAIVDWWYANWVSCAAVLGGLLLVFVVPFLSFFIFKKDGR